MKKVLSKALALLLSAAMLIPMGIAGVYAEEGGTPAETSSDISIEQIKELLGSVTYQEYLRRYSSAAAARGSVTLKGADYDASATNAKVTVLNGFEGVSGALLTPEEGSVTWKFSVHSAGLYNIKVDYYPIESYDANGNGVVEDEELLSRGNTIERAFRIDGEYPFKESRYCEFQRVWEDQYVQCVFVNRLNTSDALYQYKLKSESKWTNFAYDGYFTIPIITDGRKPEEIYDLRAVSKKDPSVVLEAALAVETRNDLRDGFELDRFGNEIRPQKVQAPVWLSEYAADSTGYNEEPFAYYLEKGEHTLTMEAVQEPMVVGSVTVAAGELLSGSVPDYENYKNQYANTPAVSAETLRIDAEMPDRTSQEIVYPTYDRSSAITDPQSASLIKLNTLGGEKWQTVGQWVEWDFEVAETGLYNIVPRFSQDFRAGMYVSRSLTIAGKIPFREASRLRFNYNASWQCKPLGYDKEDKTREDFVFYLEKGVHTIRLNVALGTMAEVIERVEACLTDINQNYLKVLMLTGPNPDKYRDYEFSLRLPDVLDNFIREANELKAVSAQMEEIIGEKGDNSVTLDNVAQLLERMGKNEDNIAAGFDTLKTYIGNLGTWIQDSRNQPLELDFIEIVPAGGKVAQDDANFFQAFGFEMSQFIMSFFSDYSGYGARSVNSDADTKVIEVWTSSGRDQASIIRSMISDDFTPNNNIMVDLKLITASTLLPATLSGAGPDVAMTISTDNIVNYAIRNAIIPLQEFEGFDEHLQQYAASATTPITLYGNTFALPETQSFSVLFYRMDILASLNKEIPRSWDDVYAMLPELQTNHLQMGMPNSLPGLVLFLYQRVDDNGDQVQLYKGNGVYNRFMTDQTFGMEINLDSDVALDCFKQMSEFFTMYDFPKTYEAANRFRSGEMPLLIADYTLYSQLTIFAPEIRGLWGFTLIPGTVQKDGTINHTTNSGVSGTMMMNTCENKKEAWEYMKWWTGADAQSKYGTEYKALLGASGQYATANREALFRMPWTASERQTLGNCFSVLTATPDLPGGYIIARNVEFAFLNVYNNDADPVQSLLSYIDAINSELSRKRAEFDLPLREDFLETD